MCIDLNYTLNSFKGMEYILIPKNLAKTLSGTIQGIDLNFHKAKAQPRSCKLDIYFSQCRSSKDKHILSK
jgi:hypothetical protein